MVGYERKGWEMGKSTPLSTPSILITNWFLQFTILQLFGCREINKGFKKLLCIIFFINKINFDFPITLLKSL